SAHGATNAALARLSELARTDVTLRLRGVEVGAPKKRASSVAVAFAFAERPAERFVLVVETALAADLCMRALKRKSPKVIDPKHAPPDALAGAFGAFVVAAARATAEGAPLVHWCGDASDLTAAGLPARVVDVRALVLVENDAFEAHLLAPLDVVRRAPRPRFDHADLAALGETPITLPLVVAASAVASSVVADLEVDDLFVPTSFPKRRGEAYAGDVVLAAPASARGLRARLGEDGKLVVLDGSEEIAMGADDEVVTENAGDAPLVVRVEVGNVTLRAREWAALKAGDVVATGQKLADPVVLRVGGVEVARGELVEVEGEVGVRILSRT
ncbi:MAG TPA: FliM/FliN family flagellar motor switch protein, partial [Polyangiaceae bacterium]